MENDKYCAFCTAFENDVKGNEWFPCQACQMVKIGARAFYDREPELLDGLAPTLLYEDYILAEINTRKKAGCKRHEDNFAQSEAAAVEQT
jgi:hypothetical protein